MHVWKWSEIPIYWYSQETWRWLCRGDEPWNRLETDFSHSLLVWQHMYIEPYLQEVKLEVLHVVNRSYLLYYFIQCHLNLPFIPVLYLCFIHASHLLTAAVTYGLPVAWALTCHLSSPSPNHLCLSLQLFYTCDLCLFFTYVLPCLQADNDKAVGKSWLVNFFKIYIHTSSCS